MQSVSQRRFIRTTTYKMFQEKKTDTRDEEEMIQKKLKIFHQRLNSLNISSKEIKIPDGSEISPRVYKELIGSITATNHNLRSSSDTGFISQFANLYDKTVNNASERKKERKIQAEMMNEYQKKINFVQGIINDVVNGVSNNDNFGKYARSSLKISGFKEFFDKVLQGKPPIVKSVAFQTV